jgi:hypothetical protein
MKNRLALCLAGAALCAAGPAFAGDGKNLIKMIPAESQIVMVFDVADARDSTLLQKGYTNLLAAKPDAKAKLAEIGLDPIKDIDTVLFAGTPKGGEFDDMTEMVIIVEGRIPAAKLALMPDAKATKYLGTTIYTKGDGDVAVLGDKLFFTRAGKMKAALDLASNKGKGKGRNAADSPKGKKLRDALGKTDTAADLWLTVLIPESAKADMKKQGMSADVVSVGVNFTADIAAGLKIVTDSEATAQKAVGLIQGQLAQVSQMAGTIGLAKAAKSLLVAQDKATVNLNFTLSEAELQSIMNLVGMGAAAAPPPATKSTTPATGTRPTGTPTPGGRTKTP